MTGIAPSPSASARESQGGLCDFRHAQMRLLGPPSPSIITRLPLSTPQGPPVRIHPSLHATRLLPSQHSTRPSASTEKAHYFSAVPRPLSCLVYSKGGNRRWQFFLTIEPGKAVIPETVVSSG